MNPITKVINYLRKGGEKVGIVESLNKITDHPRVTVDEREYQRIVNAMEFYKGNLPDEEYSDYKGSKCKRKFYSLPMPVVVSEYLANLIINESFSLEVTKGGTEDGESVSDEYINQVFEDNAFKKMFGQYLSPMFGVGGLAVKPYVNRGKIEFSWALADAFFPLRSSSNKISEGVFVSTTKRGKKYYTLLEFHTWRENYTGKDRRRDDIYMIDNELYESDIPGKIGRKVSVKTLYDDLEEHAEIPGLTRPLFAYLKPSSFNNINPQSLLGLGIIDNAKNVLEQINNTNNQMEYDMKKATPKTIGSEHFFKALYDERTGEFKSHIPDGSDSFMMVGGDAESAVLKDMTMSFEPQMYIDKINYHFLMLEKKIKLQQGTFSMDKERGIKTATQVVSEDSDTFRTRNMEISQIETFLKELTISVVELSNSYGLYTRDVPTFGEIAIDFDDGIFTSKQQELEFYSKGLDSGIVPKKEAIKRIYKLNDEQAEDWLNQINEEKKQQSTELQEVMSDVSLNGKWE